jgi:prepilin-type N-terminal cleavage/methylation domain-containing protein
MPNFKFKLESKLTKTFRGFTLIELLISITILAVISSIGFVTYTNSQIAARDGRRKQDLRSIATALELYYQTNKRYPCPGSNVWLNSSGSGNWLTDNDGDLALGSGGCGDTADKPLDSTYINLMPTDPKNSGGNYPPSQSTTTFTYGYRGFDTAICSTKKGQFYLLTARLENANDPDRNGVRNIKDCNGGSLNTGNWANMFVLSSE